MRKQVKYFGFWALVLCLPFIITACPEETLTPIPLLKTLPLDRVPNDISSALAVDSARSRAYVADGQRIRTIDLNTLDYSEPGAASGVFYGIDDEDDLVAGIAPDDGQVRQILAYDTPLAAEFATGMAYNPDTGTAFVLDIASPGGAAILYEMDMTSGFLTQVGPVGLEAGVMRALCLARDPADGRLYTVTPEDFLYAINAESGLAVQVGYVGADFDNIQELAFTPEGALYGIHSGTPSKLVLLNKGTGTGSLAAELPLGYTFGSLAIKPDGKLWAVDLTRNRLVQIDPGDGAILTEFDTLVMSLPYKYDLAFEGIDSLTWFPSEPACGRIYESDLNNFIDTITLCDAEGSILAASINYLHHFDNTLGLTQPPAHPFPFLEMGPQFLHLVHNPANGMVYGYDQMKGLVYEIRPESLEVIRQFRYIEASSETLLTCSNPMAVDPDTGRLFFQHDEGDVYIIDLYTENIQPLNYELPVEGIMVDATRRFLYLATRGGAPKPCLDKLNLDTLERLNRTSFDNTIGMMVFDPVRNRMAVNARVGITFTSKVFFHDLETLERLSFDVSLESLDTRIALDPESNLLILTAIETPPQVRIYQLPD